MTRIATLLVGLLTAACDSTIVIVSTSPSGISLPSTRAVRAIRPITIGEHVTGLLPAHGSVDAFELTARSSGTLVVRVSWSTRGRLELWLGDTLCSQTDASPIVARLPVVAGQRYQLKIADAAAWDYDEWSMAYTMTTAVE